MRQCVCGEQIEPCVRLCDRCRSEYGTKSEKWPKWLSEWMSMYQKEIDYDRNNFHLKYIDEIDYSRSI
jgi:hypothetical protein